MKAHRSHSWGIPEPRLGPSLSGTFLRSMFPKMKLLLHCNQGFIANLVLTLNSELLYVCSRFSVLRLRSQHSRLRMPGISHPVHFWQTSPNRLQYGREISRQKVHFHKLRRNSQ